MSLNSPEPKPSENEGTPIWELVIQDMKERNEAGISKYGTPLRAFNGRKVKIDKYQELLDLVVYSRQELEEDFQRDLSFEETFPDAFNESFIEHLKNYNKYREFFLRRNKGVPE